MLVISWSRTEELRHVRRTTHEAPRTKHQGPRISEEMPLYEYECEACGHRFEVIQRFSDPLIESCPKCGSHVRKLVASPAFQFKGSGWYVTDYARKEAGSAAPKGDNATSKESSAS